jgi:MFS family permease
MSGQAVGGLLGGVVVGHAGRRLSPVHLLGVGAVVFGLLDLALFNYPLVLSGFWIGLVLMILIGLPVVGMSAGMTTLLQSGVRDEYRGRVFGTLSMTSALLRLAGTALAGGLGDLLGPIVLLTIQGGAYIAAGTIALLTLPRALRRVETRWNRERF